MKNLEIHYSDDWAALYVDGNLVTVGDSYLAEEKAFELLGVKQIQDDSFMRGQTSSDGVAVTLAAVNEYRATRDAAEAKARELREEARILLERADELTR